MNMIKNYFCYGLMGFTAYYFFDNKPQVFPVHVERLRQLELCFILCVAMI